MNINNQKKGGQGKQRRKLSLAEKENRITAVCIVVMILCGCIITVIYAERHKPVPFDFEKIVDEAALKVGEEEITFKETAYYIMTIESNLNVAAANYNPDDYEAFWKVRIKNEHKSIYNLAKTTLKNACIRDFVYYQQALSEGYQLSEAEEREVKDNAISEINKLTKEQREKTAYTLEDMQNALTVIRYAKNYVADLMDEGYTQEELDTGGEKYEEIAENYKIEEQNPEIWNQMRIGTIIIN